MAYLVHKGMKFHSGKSFLLILVLLATVKAQFIVEPQSVVQSEGLDSMFNCLHSAQVLYGWIVNGIHSASSSFPSDVTIKGGIGGSSTMLIIPTALHRNNTHVQCRVLVVEGEMSIGELSQNATLQVQGPLQSVSTLHYEYQQSSPTSITISWTPPFSLNLTTAEPDIQYCVDVYNVTGGGVDLLESVCDITVTLYTFSASDPDQLFNFTVTPRSNVEGSLNGTISVPVQGYLIQVPLPIPADRLYFWTNVDLDPVVLTFPIEVHGTSSGRMPTSYTVTVNHSLSWCTCPTTHTIVNSTVELTLVCAHNCTLSRHQVYSLTVIATNRAGSSQSFPGLHTSTRDIQNVVAVHYLQQQLLTVQCSYLSGSIVRGVFIIVHSPASISYHVVYRNGTESVTEFSIASHGLQEHYIAVFDLENGLPESVPAATVKATITYNSITDYISIGLTPSTPPLVRFESTVTSANGVICLSCSFSSAALTGCVGVIHSAQLDNLTLTVLMITVDSSDNEYCTDAESVSAGLYYVIVFGLSTHGFDESPSYRTTIDTNPESTTVLMSDTPTRIQDQTGFPIGITLGVVLTVVVILQLICICVTCGFVCKRRQKIEQAAHGADRVDWSTAFPGIEQPNEAYSTAGMERNIAYEKPQRSHHSEEDYEEIGSVHNYEYVLPPAI